MLFFPLEEDEIKSKNKGAGEQYDATAAIIEWEAGRLDQDGVIELFQHLVDTGLAWRLEDCYGRMAQTLIDNGLVTPKGKTHGAEGGKTSHAAP